MGIFVIQKKSLVLLFLFYETIGSKKLSSHDFNGVHKLDECKRCKVLTDSINYWLDKTSRGKYEGGDAAWEETKLKSYSRSEVRLVEIQEGLCSEVKTYQDACYAIAEEAEQLFEKWWFNKNPTSADLHTSLCIEDLQHCCPSEHYGIACTPCPQDNENKVCAGNGRCDGAGTRKGNGTCICKRGYIGRMCKECAQNFYLTSVNSCKVCDKSCNGCSGEGSNACKECNSGWHLQSGACVDIDECSSSVCELNQYCVNTEGSYSCIDCESSCKTCRGEGPSNCLSCDSNNMLWFGMCIDSELKQNILIGAYKRLALYIGLLIITLFIFHTSRLLASIVILVIALFMYLSEINLKMNTINIFFQSWYAFT